MRKSWIDRAALVKKTETRSIQVANITAYIWLRLAGVGVAGKIVIPDEVGQQQDGDGRQVEQGEADEAAAAEAPAELEAGHGEELAEAEAPPAGVGERGHERPPSSPMR